MAIHLSLTLLLLLAVGLATSQTVWPQPKFMSMNSTLLVIDGGRFEFAAASAGAKHPIVEAAVERYRQLMFGRASGRAPRADEPLLKQLSIRVDSDDDELSWRTDESYTLTVAAPAAQLHSRTIFGALRGLETFSQLVHLPAAESSAYAVHCGRVDDAPRYQHRGFLLDTARHYLPVPLLLEHIDALAYSKFNVLHWHVVDDQSFPFQSERFPLLSQRGAFAPDRVYTKHDVRRVVAYGISRGVRVIPEFDSPGHVTSWGRGYPQLLSAPPSDSTNDVDERGGLRLTCPLDPVANFTYTLLEGLLAEVAELFPDQYLHVGGDEIPIDACWAQLAASAGSTPRALLAAYEARLLDIVQRLGRQAVVWEEVFTSGVPLHSDTIVALWKSRWETKLAAVESAGLRAIVYSPWYLNYINYGESWKAYYQADLGTSAAVIGGSGAMWSEFVDASNSVARTWPFACAVGERLWSPRTTTDLVDAGHRLAHMHCRLLSRGIAAQPPTGPGFCPDDVQPVYRPPFDIDDSTAVDDAQPPHNWHAQSEAEDVRIRSQLAELKKNLPS